MRVAIVAESFLPNMNGVTNSVLRVLEHLGRTGHDAMVIAPDTIGTASSAPTEHDGIPVVRVPAVMVPKVSSLPVGVPMPRVNAAVRAFAPHVMHLASPFLLGAGGVGVARYLDIPTVAVYQTDVAGFAESYGLGVTSRAAWAWTRRIHKSCDRTLAPSTAAVDALEEHRIPRVYRWARGVDAQQFAPSRRSVALRRSWIGDSDRLVVGFVGRLAPEKHVERLAVLAADPSVQIVVVGDGPDRGELQRSMPGAIFTGQLGGDELAAAYASLDVFVHPGEHETFCQAVQEALASAIPAVGPDAGGPRDLIEHRRNGYLLPVEGFGQALPGVIDALRRRERRAQMGTAARQSVLHRTWPAICEELLRHYDDVQGLHRHSQARAA
ncbi:phosphatidylinositol alpha 1,6-mannosyltransferase [Rhodococcus sp. 27YEA15]|uniref:glycosyltransferase family 4 protein n=1 Tax=Rhodococcus sp. 27YEA15 TaxID=3156259 RepID=UPI003C7986E0